MLNPQPDTCRACGSPDLVPADIEPVAGSAYDLHCADCEAVHYWDGMSWQHYGGAARAAWRAAHGEPA